MEENGKNKIAMLSIVALILLIGTAASQNSLEYYVCSYQEDSWGADIMLAAINLDSREVSWVVNLPLEGEINFKKPLIFHLRNTQLFFVSTVNGMPAKNSVASNNVELNYGIVDHAGRLILTGQMPDIHLRFFNYFGLDTVWIDYIQGSRDNTRQLRGYLTLNQDFRPVLAPVEEYLIPEPEYPEIAGFKYFHRISEGNDRLFWGVTLAGTYLLSLDMENRLLIDSVNVESNVSYFHLFGLSDSDSSIYVFYMNHNTLVGPESMQKLSIDPAYVKILHASSFALVDSVPIAYPPLDSGYVGGTTGVCDRVGPYLVYYDLSSDGLEYFCPAMLFIFDTRTNEASWLRVGWR